MVPSKILNLMAFVPAEDFELSRRFYRDLSRGAFACYTSPTQQAYFGTLPIDRSPDCE